MIPVQSTPVPNTLFDVFLTDLKASELKILLVIIRQTLGWKNNQENGGRKERDWISTSQLERKTGVSRRAISTSLSGLIQKGLIRVTNHLGHELIESTERQGKLRLYYELTLFSEIIGDNQGKTCLKELKTGRTSAEIAEDIGKKVTALAQEMLITKETLQN